MFTGIIETKGTVHGLVPAGGGVALQVQAGPVAQDAKLGDSIAVHGVCLTVSRRDGERLGFDVIRETLQRSTLGRLQVGDRVNLERSLAVGDRLGGHFVQGHVDGQAHLVRRVATAAEFTLWFEPDAELLPGIVPKGSIAVDGVSLTIAETTGNRFSVALVPTTLERSTLGELREWDPVNIETDILVRTVRHLLSQFRWPATGGLTLDKLHEHGFA